MKYTLSLRAIFVMVLVLAFASCEKEPDLVNPNHNDPDTGQEAIRFPDSGSSDVSDAVLAPPVNVVFDPSQTSDFFQIWKGYQGDSLVGGNDGTGRLANPEIFDEIASRVEARNIRYDTERSSTTADYRQWTLIVSDATGLDYDTLSGWGAYFDRYRASDFEYEFSLLLDSTTIGNIATERSAGNNLWEKVWLAEVNPLTSEIETLREHWLPISFFQNLGLGVRVHAIMFAENAPTYVLSQLGVNGDDEGVLLIEDMLHTDITSPRVFLGSSCLELNDVQLESAEIKPLSSATPESIRYEGINGEVLHIGSRQTSRLTNEVPYYHVIGGEVYQKSNVWVDDPNKTEVILKYGTRDNGGIDNACW